jgi:hypothetical protein
MSNGHDKAKACVPGQKVGNAVQNCPPKTGAIWVYVKDSQGKGVGNVNLSAPAAATTDATGLAVFDSLAVKNYVVTLSKLPDQAAQNYYLLDADRTMRAVGVTAGSINKVVFQLKLKPTPTISANAPKIVLVKRAYQGKDKPGVKPHRIPVRLGVDTDFDGHGELTVNHDDVKLFEKQDDKTEKALPYSAKAAELKAGKTVWLQGKNPSADVASTELKLTLKGGAIPPKKVDATEKITCVQLQLDIYAVRPEGGAEPAKIDEGKKIDPGRNILEQGATAARLWAQRAKLVVERALPSTYTGNVVLKSLTGGVEAFKDTEEKPASGQKAITAANLKWANKAIDAASGQKLWVQGKAHSAKMSDTGWKVELEVLPDVEGDRVTMTVLKAEIALCKSRTDVPAKKPRPEEFNDNDKFDKGRYVHLQDTSFHHGRAMIVVKKVKPDGFVGKLELKAFDATQKPSYSAVKSGAPKVKIFKEEVAKGGQAAIALPHTIDHPAGYPADGQVFWVEGATVSGALRDCELRLGVTDVDIGCDRVELTVVQFSNLTATIPGTPPQPARVAPPVTNTPVADQVYTRAGAGTALHYSEDDGPAATANRALVLIEGSQPAAKFVAMSVKIAPVTVPAVPVRWSIQRDVRKGSGDIAAVIALNAHAIPTLSTNSGLTTKMSLDAVGTFHVRPYVDCNDSNAFEHNLAPTAAHPSGERIDREPFIIMNLILVRVKAGDNSASRANNAHLTFTPAAPTTAGNFRVSSTDVAPLSPWTNAVKTRMGCRNNATAIVTGGGPKGRNGLDRVYSAWVNNRLTSAGSRTVPPGPNIVSEYQETPAPPPPPAPPPAPIIHPRIEIWDGLSAGTGPVYLPAPPPPPPPVVPIIMGGPFLDTSHASTGGAGTGGNTCTGTEGDWGPPIAVNKTDLPTGQTWRVEMWDSPGRTIPAQHEGFPGTVANPIPIIHALLNWDFRSDLVFWTNIQGGAANAGATGDPADRLYATVITNNWDIRVDVTFNVVTGAGTINTRTLSMTKVSPPGQLAIPCEGNAVQVRAPVSLEMNAVDART